MILVKNCKNLKDLSTLLKGGIEYFVDNLKRESGNITLSMEKTISKAKRWDIYLGNGPLVEMVNILHNIF